MTTQGHSDITDIIICSILHSKPSSFTIQISSSETIYNLDLVRELNFSCKALTWCIVLHWGSFWPCDCSAVILFIYIFKHSCSVLLGVLVSCAAGLFLSRRILMFVRERRCGKEWSTSSCSYKLICITTGGFSPASPSPPFTWASLHSAAPHSL